MTSKLRLKKIQLRPARKTKAGTMLRAARKKEGFVLQQVEDATGITYSGIAHMEKGKSVPTIRSCYLLAEFYGISFEKVIKAVLEDEL